MNVWIDIAIFVDRDVVEGVPAGSHEVLAYHELRGEGIDFFFPFQALDHWITSRSISTALQRAEAGHEMRVVVQVLDGVEIAQDAQRRH